MQGNQTEKYTLLYGRLSNEDKRESTSLSIQHQEEMLRDYAEKHGFRNPLFLYDDGVSGTKANRPGFQKVLAMIREGQAATLIVTDLTRLYRNQSEANNLLEIVFPALGVRFIAITNNYDSATNTESDEDLAMFSNLFNEWYPRQTSRKINAVIQHKAEKGVRIASIPPYGYQKDPVDKFKIIPDPEAAEKVRHIFSLCASGMGPEQIAKRLEREKVLVPTEYAYRKFGRNHSSRNPDFPYRWSNSSIANILENPDYIGIQISCKTHKPSYKSDLVVEVPEEERYRVENAHEPIIDRELWDIVQRVRTNKRRPTKLGEMDMLAGMVQCADCGSTHYLCRCGSWDESKYTYVCGKYHRHKEECTPHTVKALHLREAVLQAIQTVVQTAKADREAFSAHLTAKQSGQLKKELTAKRKELEQARKRLTEVDNLIAATFEKLATGILTDEQFQQLNGRYLAEQESLKAGAFCLEAELTNQQNELDNVGNFLAIVDRHLEVPELTPEILREFVHHIKVHERDGAYKKKFYTQDIDIYFNYIGIIQ